jgi:hypothetical protein
MEKLGSKLCISQLVIGDAGLDIGDQRGRRLEGWSNTAGLSRTVTVALTRAA